MKTVERTEYLNKLIAFRDKELIKVVTGVRRCGKSKLLEIFREYLLKQGVNKERIIDINFEDYDFSELKNPDKLYKYIKERLSDNETTYVFLDEIQHVTDFPKVLDALFIKKNVDLYVTGSNAYMLSSEIATLISGRYVEIKMLPLSFKEYVSAVGGATEAGKKYVEYITGSSFPYALQFRGQPKELRDYLEGVYNTVVIKDVATRKNIVDVTTLQSIARYTFDNVGNLLSTKKIADTLTSNGRKTDVKTVEKYVEALQESFILYHAKRYDVRGKQYLKTLGKYYVVDIGMRYMLLGTRGTDVGHILENVVYLELIRRGYEVYVGKADELEIDFVAISESEINYFQVAASVRDDDVLKRELAPLKKANDHHPKFLLTLDDDPEADYDGIKRINALDWLLD